MKSITSCQARCGTSPDLDLDQAFLCLLGDLERAEIHSLDHAAHELADLTEDISLESEAVCGGTARVFIEAWQPGEDSLKLVDLLKNLMMKLMVDMHIAG